MQSMRGSGSKSCSSNGASVDRRRSQAQRSGSGVAQWRPDPAMSDPVPRTFKQRHILLVEDDPDVRDIVEQILTDEGYEVDATGTLNDGIALLHSRRYDLVISDARLPDGSGTDVVDAAANRGTGTLVLTGYGFDLRARHRIVPKPFLPLELIRAVETALRD
jgi:DNA-binding NtrC family response regulator